MRFYTIEINGCAEAAVSFDGGHSVYSLRSLGLDYEDLNQFLCESTHEIREDLRKRGNSPISVRAIRLTDGKLCAPIPCPRQDMICLGINYREHAVEAEGFSGEAFGGPRPYTIYFSKRVNRASASGESIPSYEGLVDSLDYETELGVVLGADVFRVSEAAAEQAIFGYTVINDVSARNLQTRHKQWYVGKSLDGFSPMGPCIVTPEELGAASDLSISCTVNGEIRQQSNTRHMICSAASAISELSQGMTLKAGTILATGTPSGVGMGFTPPRFLKHGDRIVCRIERIGELVNTVD